MRKTELFRIMPWTGGWNTSVDPGVLNSQELVQADNVQFSSTGARIKREALQYLDHAIPVPDFRSSSTTTRTLKWTTAPVVNYITKDERLVVGELINVTGVADYTALAAEILSVTPEAEVTSIVCVADVAGSLAGKYFNISGGDEGNDFYVWFSVSGSGTDPEISGRTAIPVSITTGDTDATVATAVAAAIAALDEFSASALGATVTVTAADAGYCVAPAAGTSGFTITVTTEGSVSITYTGSSSVTESIIAAGAIVIERASAVIWAHDYWRYSAESQGNEQLLVYATEDFQLFKLDASGRRAQILGQEQTSVVTCAAASTLTTGDYWLINSANNTTAYYVWYDKDGAGGNPLVSGRTAIPVAVLAADTAAQVATKTKTALDLVGVFTTTLDTATLTIVADTAGLTDPAVDFNTGFVIATSADGATMPTSTVARVRMLVYNERLHIFMSGVGNYHVIYNPDDSAKYQLPVSNRGGGAAGIDMPDASFGVVHLGRIWTDDKTTKDYLHYCETFDETIWLGIGDSGALPISPGDGDPEGIVNAYVYKGFLVVAKKQSRHRILGDSPENFVREQISQGMGNEGPMHIPVDETDVIFLSKRGIHSQQATDSYGDTDAAYLSADIQPTFNESEQSQIKLAQGAYIPELNSIAISMTQDGEQRPNDVWLYNFEVQVQGKQRPGAWFRWPDISCTALNRRFTNDKYKLIFGTSAGRIVQAQKENDYTDFGTTGILFRAKTGTIYPGNDPQSMKAFKKITMIYRPRGNFSFAVSAKIDNHEAQGFAFNEQSGLDLLGEDFILGTSLLGSSNTLAPYTFTMEGYGRGVTLTITQPSADEQIEIWGFALEFENADLAQEVQ